MKLFLFSKRMMLYSHVAIQILYHRSVLALQCSVTLNCQLQQAFSKCKLIFSVSKIYPACSVAFVCNVLGFSQMNGAAW